MIDHNNDAERVEREKAYLKTDRVTAGSVAGNGKGVIDDPCDENPEKSVAVFDQILKDYEQAFKGNETSLADVEKALAARRNSQDEMPMPLPPVPKEEPEAPFDYSKMSEDDIKRSEELAKQRADLEYLNPAGMDMLGWWHPKDHPQFGNEPGHWL